MKQSEILDQSIRSMAKRERLALGDLIAELRKLDQCRGYLELGYSSLFDYLTKGVGYSAGSAQRRIDAARLFKDVPELKENLQTGNLDLHHVATVSKAVRQIKKERTVSAAEKVQVFKQIQKQTEAKTQQVVAEFFDLALITETKRTVQKDQSVRLEITVSQEVAELIQKAQGLISHSVPTQDLASFLEYVARKIIKQKSEPARRNKTEPKTVSESMRRRVKNHQPFCVRCGSKWFLQVDHKTSKWVGGSHEIVNLQTLCGPCNRQKYRKESGMMAKH